MKHPASAVKTTERLADAASRAVREHEWAKLTALLAGPLVPELMQPVLRVLRPNSDLDPQTLSDLARTLVRRLDVGAEAAVVDLRMWTEAADPLRNARLRAWTKLSAGWRGDVRAAQAAPALWIELLGMNGFTNLPKQARAVALIEASQSHWRAARGDGDISNMARAIELGEEAAATAAGLPHVAEALTVAGDACLDLWLVSPPAGGPAKAISYARSAYELTEPTHPRRGWRAARLAGKLVNKSIHEGTMGPLDEALDLLRGAPQATADPEDRCGVLHSLAVAAGRRWQIAHDRRDLDLSVQAARRAVHEVPPESRDVRIMLSGLASALRRLGVETNSVAALEEALGIRRELVEIEIDEPRQAVVRSNLAISLRCFGAQTGNRDLLDEAVVTLSLVLDETSPEARQYPSRLQELARCFQARALDEDLPKARRKMEEAVRAAHGRPEVRAFVFNELGQLLEKGNDRIDAARAYEEALDELLDLQRREDHLSDRLTQMGRIQNLPANATRAALRAWDGASALRLADKGRIVVLTEILGNRPPAYCEGAQDNLLCIGAADAGGFAILSTADGVVAEECPELTSEAVVERIRSFGVQLDRRQIARAAANAAIEELARWLGVQLRLDNFRLPPDLSIVTLGPLGLLPVHLAIYEGRALFLQRTVTMRLRASRNAPDIVNRFLGEATIIIPVSDRLDPLLLVDQETKALGQAVVRASALRGLGASRAAALDALQTADLVHFAGHARSFPDRPLESCIYLSGDESLTVGDLLSVLPSGHLAVVALTGCETAVVGHRIPDESVSLAAAAVVAGATVALSTLWPVSQVAAALMCTRFYAHLHEQPDNPACALANAQRWMSEASDSELAATCEALGAPVSDPHVLRNQLHWAGWTITTL